MNRLVKIGLSVQNNTASIIFNENNDLSDTLSLSNDSRQNLLSNNTSISHGCPTSTSNKDKVENKKKIVDVTRKAFKLWKDCRESQRQIYAYYQEGSIR